jgi:ribosomal protein L7/L12
MSRTLLVCDPAAMSHGPDVPLSTEYSELTILGWREGFLKISFIKLLQRDAGFGLAEAKQATDEVLDDKAIRVRVPTDRRDGFIAEAKALGIRDIRVG